LTNSATQTIFQTSNAGIHRHLHDNSPRVSIHQSPTPNDAIDSPRPVTSAGHGSQRAPLVEKGRCYDRPGKKPATDLEPNPIKLYETICKERGGNNFATDWVLVVFKYGVSKDSLHRALKPGEVATMNFTGGFKPRQAYDGFVTKIKDRYECGLCREDKKTHWKTKKDAPRHLRKFHFGLADVCKVWYALLIVVPL